MNMAAKLGSIKSISGQTEVIAVDKSGNERILKVGDSLYEGESIKTTSADAKVVIVANDGKEVSIVGEDTSRLIQKRQQTHKVLTQRSQRFKTLF